MSESLLPLGGTQTSFDQTLLVIMPLSQAVDLGDQRLADRIACRVAR
ncbi:MAG: hypothetical protein ACPG31_12615 [Planctomycetota bacterium]